MRLNASLLVVDDDEDNREMMAECFALEGFVVTTAANGEDALARAATGRPSVVLMDLAMPGPVDGWEATRRIKAHPLLRDTIVIAVTAHAFPAGRQAALHAGCHLVFLKPIDVPAVAAVIERILTERAAPPSLQ